MHSAVFWSAVPSSSSEVGENTLFTGEYTVVAWLDQSYAWELGVVENHTPTITLVSHLVPTNKSKRSWIFSEEAGILAVDTDQILLKANEELTNFGSA